MKKLGRKKVWVPVIALCSVGLIVGTGYAAWTITGGNNKQEKTGNRKADTVTDKHVDIKNLKWFEGTKTADFTTDGISNPEVCFGWKTQDEGVNSSWLKNDQMPEYKEKMEYNLYFEIDKGKDATSITPTATFEYTDVTLPGENKGIFATCVDDQLIVAPTNAELAPKSASVDGKDAYYVNVVFKWGSLFRGKNPINYYNGLAKPDYSSAADSLGKLAKLNGNNVTFKVTIQATATK